MKMKTLLTKLRKCGLPVLLIALLYFPLSSVGYLNQDDVVLTTGLKRYNFMANMDGKINDFISVGLNIAGANFTEKYAETPGDYQFSDYEVLFPIPVSEIRINPKLTQNEVILK